MKNFGKGENSEKSHGKAKVMISQLVSLMGPPADSRQQGGSVNLQPVQQKSSKQNTVSRVNQSKTYTTVDVIHGHTYTEPWKLKADKRYMRNI